MSLDLFTLLVQILNFLLLILLLKKFLYGPLMNAIKARQDYVRSTVEEAERKFEEAEGLKKTYQEELDDVDKYKKNRQEKIDAEMDEYKVQKLEEVKVEVQQEREEFLRQLENEKTAMVDALVKNICSNINDFLVDIFVSLSNSSLESAILAKFLDEIANFPNEIIARINTLEDENLNFTSSFELNDGQKNMVREALQQRGVENKNVIFARDGDIVLGNKITIGSLTINSNIENIVEQFRNGLKQVI